jgi:lipid-binding SYLF domain-containing protein
MAMPSRPPSRIAGRIEPIACAAVLYVLSAALGGCAQRSKPAAAGGAAAPTQAVAARMVEHGAQHGESFLSHTQTTAIRNMLGGARGVFLAPDMTGEAAIVGVQRGTGFLLWRHGKEWSDPVFFSLTEASIGYQAGVKTSHTLILLVTDTAVTNSSRVRASSAGAAVGPRSSRPRSAI